jgi:hypothetical protein
LSYCSCKLTFELNQGIIYITRGDTGKRLRPRFVLEVIVHFVRCDYFFFFMLNTSPITAMITRQNCNRSDHVTYISIAPFYVKTEG